MKTNLSFFIVLLIAIVTFINDIIIYFFKLDYVLSLVISVAGVLVSSIIFIKKKKIWIEKKF